MADNVDNKQLYFPGKWQAFSTTDDTYNRMLDNIMNTDVIEVKQSHSLLEMISQGCCEVSNQYNVYNPSAAVDPQEPKITLVEDSECFNRCCCAPIHTYKMQLLGGQEAKTMAKPSGGWESTEVLGNRRRLMYREGCMSKCLCCFSCTEMCANNARVLVEGQGDPQTAPCKYTFEEKLCNGCTPEIVIKSVADGDLPIAVITGPCMFGGCYELCADFDYTISSLDATTMQPGSGFLGDIAIVKKKKPEGCCEMLIQAVSDTDNFSITFTKSQYNQDPEFRAVALAALVYLDFMFFELDNGVCGRDENGGCKITCFNCYCCGTICPCTITVGGNSGGE